MEIIYLSPSRLQNEEYGNYHKEIDGEVSRVGAPALNISVVYDPYHQQVLALQEVLEPIGRDPLTVKIMTADQGRDSLHHALTGLVNALCRHYDLVKRDAALELKTVTDHYADLPTRSYNNQTNGTVNFIDTLRNSHAAALTALGIADWIDELEVRNNAFADALNERHAKEQAASLAKIREIRPVLDVAYKALVKRINAMLELNSTPELVALAQFINQRINYNLETIAKRLGRYAAGNETGQGEVNEGDDNEITPQPLP